jgi:hypothetical protein
MLTDSRDLREDQAELVLSFRCFRNRLLVVGFQPVVAKALAIDFEVSWILWLQI